MKGEFYHTNGLDLDPEMLELFEEDFSDRSNELGSETPYHYNMTKDPVFDRGNGIPMDILPAERNHLTVDKPLHLNL